MVGAMDNVGGTEVRGHPPIETVGKWKLDRAHAAQITGIISLCYNMEFLKENKNERKFEESMFVHKM